MSVPHLATTRRTALGGALAGVVTVAGCDDGPSSDELTSGPTTAPAQDADTDVVEQLTGTIAETFGIVVAARRQDPRLHRQLRPLAELHDAHLAALDAPEDLEIPRGGRADLVDVRSAETTLQRRLTDAAVGAGSGALAQLLASMAAAIAQHLAVLPGDST